MMLWMMSEVGENSLLENSLLAEESQNLVLLDLVKNHHLAE
jgi:hypothetical protein